MTGSVPASTTSPTSRSIAAWVRTGSAGIDGRVAVVDDPQGRERVDAGLEVRPGRARRSRGSRAGRSACRAGRRRGRRSARRRSRHRRRRAAPGPARAAVRRTTGNRRSRACRGAAASASAGRSRLRSLGSGARGGRELRRTGRRPVAAATLPAAQRRPRADRTVIDPVSHVTGRPGESRWANVEFCWTTTTRPPRTWQDRPVSTAPSTRLRAASAGAVAAAVWALQEPIDQRARRLRLLRRRRPGQGGHPRSRWRAAGLCAAQRSTGLRRALRSTRRGV